VPKPDSDFERPFAHEFAAQERVVALIVVAAILLIAMLV
jgi:hypothetical protein